MFTILTGGTANQVLQAVGAGQAAAWTSAPKRTITATTLGAGATTFAAVGEAMAITGDALGNTVDTITGGVTGQILILKFIDALVTVTDTAAATANTVNLSAAFTSSANDVLTLFHDGTKWLELSRSVN